jgi:hypothetical protein
MRRFTKIKCQPDKKIVIEWAEARDLGQTDIRHQLESTDAPDPDFPLAQQAFLPELLDLLELPTDYGANLRVISLAINYEEDDRLGLVVTALKELERTTAPFVLNTPHLREDDGESAGTFLPDRMRALLDEAKEQAEAFCDGRRLQLELAGV